MTTTTMARPSMKGLIVRVQYPICQVRRSEATESHRAVQELTPQTFLSWQISDDPARLRQAASILRAQIRHIIGHICQKNRHHHVVSVEKGPHEYRKIFFGALCFYSCLRVLLDLQTYLEIDRQKIEVSFFKAGVMTSLILFGVGVGQMGAMLLQGSLVFGYSLPRR
jgi:hypothetical protein